MTATVKILLDSFENLTDTEKLDLVTEVVRRTDIFSAPELSEGEQVALMEDLFFAMERD